MINTRHYGWVIFSLSMTSLLVEGAKAATLFPTGALGAVMGLV
jgi:hypothetical protein